MYFNNYKKIKGDASYRKFFRDKKSNSIIVYAKKDKKINLLIYASINKLLSKNKIYTPNLQSGCLNGVLRKNLIKIIKLTDLSIEETDISPFDLVSADELFITNVIQGIVPVTNYRKKKFDIEISSRLINLLNDSVSYS